MRQLSLLTSSGPCTALPKKNPEKTFGEGNQSRSRHVHRLPRYPAPQPRLGTLLAHELGPFSDYDRKRGLFICRAGDGRMVWKGFGFREANQDPDREKERLRMVADQLKARGIADARVLEAMG